jgi:hypothetical protein
VVGLDESGSLARKSSSVKENSTAVKEKKAIVEWHCYCFSKLNLHERHARINFSPYIVVNYD